VVVTTEAVVVVVQRLLAVRVLDLTHLQAQPLMAVVVVLVPILYLLGLQQQALAHQVITQAVVVVLVFLLLAMAAVLVVVVQVAEEQVDITMITMTETLDTLRVLMALQTLAVVVVQAVCLQQFQKQAVLEL
jgi:hypothetical protein